ncbi:MAG: MaoC family dehydratase [Thiotrichales bacterium]|nr:MAG: MaoC family dehydratase [Thiotrichales bacterium]
MNRKFQVGDKSTLSKAFTQSEVEEFAKISLDDNPVHLDKEYAESTAFGQPIVHGLLVASLFSGLIGARLPGHGSVYLGQNISFKAPVFINEKIEASVEVVHVREDKPILTLKTLCVKSDGTVAIEGEAVVKVTCV